MSESTLQRASALGTRAGAAPAPLIDRTDLRLAEEPFLKILSLRTSRKETSAIDALTGSLGLPAPHAPNYCSGDAAWSCAWVEPRAWLLFGRDAVSAPAGWLVTDLSDRFMALRASGTRAPQLLAAVVSVILQSGRCARTRFAEETEVFIQQLSDEPDYRLLIDAGHARYAADCLLDAAHLLNAQTPA